MLTTLKVVGGHRPPGPCSEGGVHPVLDKEVRNRFRILVPDPFVSVTPLFAPFVRGPSPATGLKENFIRKPKLSKPTQYSFVEGSLDKVF